MRTKGPLILVSLFLFFFGIFICWGGSILVQAVVVPGLFLFALGISSSLAGIWFLRKIVQHFISARRLPARLFHEFGNTAMLSEADERVLEQHLQKTNKWMLRNVVFGVFFLLVSFLVPVRFLSLRGIMGEGGGGYDTLAGKSGGPLIILLVLAVETFLLYSFRKEKKRLQADLAEKVKMRLPGKVKGIEKERFIPEKGTLVVEVDGMELDTYEINPLHHPELKGGAGVEVELAVRSQVILSVRPL